MKQDAEKELQREFLRNDYKAFPLVVATPNAQTSIQSIIQVYGVGALKANTILLNWMGQAPKRILNLQDQNFVGNLQAARLFDCNLVILDAKQDKWSALTDRDKSDLVIDVWWWGDATSRMMLLMAYLMTRSDFWSDAKIRLLAAGSNPAADRTIDNLHQMLEEVRIEAEPLIVDAADADAIAEHSADSSLVFLPFRLKKNRVTDPFGKPMEDSLFLLPVVAMVMAAEDIELDAEPEEGEAGEKAQVMDALEAAQKKEIETLKEAEKAVDAAQTVRKKAEEIKKSTEATDPEAVEKAEKMAGVAEKQADKLARKAAKASAKTETAVKKAEDVGALPDEPGK